MDFCPLSVVIPTYNRAAFLNRALGSIKKQTLKCAEIIVVDDGSTDNSVDIIRKFSLTSRVPIKFFQQENKGPAAARNHGIACAKNEYIAFLDSDDHWHKRKIELQYKALKENPAYLISHTKEKWLRRGVHLNQKKIHIPRHGDIFAHCLLLCGVGMSTVMVKKEIFTTVGKFDETLRCCEDYDLWLRVSCKFPFYLIDSPLTVKEGGREDQVSYLYRTGMDRMRIYAIKKILDSKNLDKKQSTLALSELDRKCSVFGNGCIKHGKREMGEYYLDLANSYTKESREQRNKANG